MAAPKKKGLKKQNISEKPHEDPKPEITKADQNLIEQLFAQTLLRYKNELVADKKQKIKELSHLSAIAEEYMSCFAIIGYSLQDEEVIVFNAPTPKDEAALADLLRATFFNITGNRP